MPKARTPTRAGEGQVRRHNPLSEDLVATGPLRTKSKKRKSRDDESIGESYVDAKSSRRILAIGRDLADEDKAERAGVEPNFAFTIDSRHDGHDDLEESNHDMDDEDSWGDEVAKIVEEVVRTHASAIYRDCCNPY